MSKEISETERAAMAALGVSLDQTDAVLAELVEAIARATAAESQLAARAEVLLEAIAIFKEMAGDDLEHIGVWYKKEVQAFMDRDEINKLRKERE
ncbi:MAG: hypothetical protein ABSG90_11730 [Dehalococcoidia bacterium]|jgi:hypothetical protein